MNGLINAVWIGFYIGVITYTALVTILALGTCFVVTGLGIARIIIATINRK